MSRKQSELWVWLTRVASCASGGLGVLEACILWFNGRSHPYSMRVLLVVSLATLVVSLGLFRWSNEVRVALTIVMVLGLTAHVYAATLTSLWIGLSGAGFAALGVVLLRLTRPQSEV